MAKPNQRGVVHTYSAVCAVIAALVGGLNPAWGASPTAQNGAAPIAKAVNAKDAAELVS
jgi:hypothetical protein